MGCGCCSIPQKAVIQPSKPPPPPIKLQHPPAADVAEVLSQIAITIPTSKYMYLIGHNSKSKPQLLQFNPQNLEFKRLTIPKTLEVFNYSSMVCIGQDKFLLSGGITADLQTITNKSFILEPLVGKAEATPKMMGVRYTHIAQYHDEYVYVFGGRQLGNDDQAIMRKCERYSLTENRWQSIPSLKVQRCTGFSLVWEDSIYVFGGYTSEFRRTKTIEIFRPKKMVWQMCEFKLHQGIECGSIAASPAPNQFILFGGNMKYGAVNTVNAYNIKQGTVHTRPKMQQARVLQKAIVHQNEVFILGGCQNNNIQICNLQTFDWKMKNSTIQKYVPSLQLDTFAYSMLPCEVKSGVSRVDRSDYQYTDQIVFLFGTDAQPFILQFNISVPYAISHPVPLSMRCYGFQGGVAVPDNKFIIMGGISEDLDQPTKHSYVYDKSTRTASRLADMNTARYAFSCVYLNQYVYALGGRDQRDDQLGLLSDCQRYSLARKKWEKISPLPFKCISCCAFVYKDRLYVTGGYSTGNDRNNKVCMYNQNSNKWEILKFSMPFGIEGAAIIWGSDKQLLFFGGRVHTGDIDSVWNMIVHKQSPTGVIEQAVFGQVGKLGQSKSLHKVYHPRHQDFVVIFGGEKQLASFYNINTHKIEQSDTLSNIFSTFSEKVRQLGDPLMKKYLLLS